MFITDQNPTHSIILSLYIFCCLAEKKITVLNWILKISPKNNPNAFRKPLGSCASVLQCRSWATGVQCSSADGGNRRCPTKGLGAGSQGIPP